ncbi:MAG: hypothetical protein H7Y18_12205, partial [Clostridiaceae bacterium]|nr:hypothetical protein [Clostridiaceae bacterium]
MKITTSEKEKLTKDNTKTKIKLIIGITFLVFIESVTLVRLHNVQTTYSNKLAEANKQNKAYKEITEGNYDIGIELLKDTEVTNEQLAKVYFMIGQFDNA